MARIRCNYCQNEINGYRIHCAECEDFDLCLQCFSLGAEIGDHKKDHSFHIKNEHGPRIFESSSESWSLAEENMLLDAVEQYGFGNWNGASQHLETRTSEQCEEHYRQFYVNGLIGDATLQEVPRPKITDHTNLTGGLAGPLSPSLTIPFAPLEMEQYKTAELGYMPLRDDFEREHDNDAETLVSSLIVTQEEDDIDISMKLAQISKYRLRLAERERRKRVAREYGLTAAGAPPLTKPPRTPHAKKKVAKGRELMERLKPFSQFHPQAEHKMLFDNLKREKEVKLRIKELIRLRKNGITKLEEEEVYEEEKFKREKRKENKKKMALSALPKRSSQVSKKADGRLELMDTTSDEKDGKAVEKSEACTEPRKELNNSMPGFDLISENEKKLCNSMGMSAANYITIKTCIIKDYLQRCNGRDVGKFRFPGGMDKTHRRKIIGFLQDNLWIGAS